ncbi:MAG: hypothetical protein IPO62_17710 [Saprospiraceae bacterium]|nr:hypothetical protein [Saprospiraceae bacterium]
MSLTIAIILGTIFLFLIFFGLLIFVVFHNAKIVALEKERSVYKVEQEKLLAEATIKSQELERQHIGDDLHDEIAPMLAGAKMYLTAQLHGLNAESKSPLFKVIEIIDKSIDRIRLISHLLHPVSLQELGFNYAIEDFCNTFMSTRRAEILYFTNVSKLLLNEFDQLLLFRVIQEIVFNAEKHSLANQFKIELKSNSNYLQILIAHNGKQFTEIEFTEGLKDKNGLGLKNIQHRLNLLKGTIKFYYDIENSEQNIFVQILIK